MRHILLATDGSKSAGRATTVAANLARAMGSRLSILTVGGTVSDEVKQFARAEGSVADALERFSNQLLHHAKQVAEKAGVSVIDVQSGWGDPAEVIIAMRSSGPICNASRSSRGSSQQVL